MTDDEQARYWNGAEAAHWLVHEKRYERILAPFTSHLLGAAAIGRAEHVIDIGCGAGSTTRAAGRLAIEGGALGVDLSAPLLRQAVRRARQDDLTNVRFEHGDAQVHRFTAGAGDIAVSRFGVMFFADPAAAFANIVRGLRRRGRLVFLCWQGPAHNEWIMIPGAAASQHIALPPPDDSTGPGPFSLSERDRIDAVLGAAGLADIAIEPVAEMLWMGHDVADAVEFWKATGMGKALLGDVDQPTAARVSEAVRAALEPYLTPEGLRLGSQAWLVTARRARVAGVRTAWR